MNKAKVISLLMCLLIVSYYCYAQKKVIIEGTAEVGQPAEGDTMLKFNSERPWLFRQLGTGAGTGLELYSTSGLKNFLINTTGNMGLGVLAPTDKLHVDGSIRANGPRLSFGSSEYFGDGGGFLIDCNGSLQSTLDGVDDLGRSGRRWRAVWASNGTISSSDTGLKSHIEKLPYGLKELMLLHPVWFEWRDQPEYGRKLGLLAQEVRQVISEVVVDSEWVRDEQTLKMHKIPVANLGMYYADLIPVLINGIQEQQEQMEAKQLYINNLEARLQDLETRMQKLETSSERPVLSNNIVSSK